MKKINSKFIIEDDPIAITKIESGSIYAGVPAKKVKEVSPEKFVDLNIRIANNYVMYADWLR